ncbi:MAG: hypothetical protein AMK69_20305 [Nitrospira bacterium SG8_3]|nr:MAG: hypothetical protein AMK69_20305 [Nitrospira bacterium SG8_3]
MSGDHNIHQADHIPDATKMIECATCGYPLAESERAGLVEINGKMHRPWVGLTNEELYELWCITKPEYEDRYGFARAVEAKLKEKNSHEPRQYKNICGND